MELALLTERRLGQKLKIMNEWASDNDGGQNLR